MDFDRSFDRRISIMKILRTLLVVLAFILVGCGLGNPPSDPREKSFSEDVIGITFLPDLTFNILLYEKEPDSVMLELENNSKYIIEFPPDYNVQLYVYNNEQLSWSDIDNRVDYVASDHILIPEKMEKGSCCDIVLIKPDFPQDVSDFSVRVVVSGKIVKDGVPTEEMVGTYIDIQWDTLEDKQNSK